MVYRHRSTFEKELDRPYEEAVRLATHARFLAFLLDRLQAHYGLPPGHERALANWADGHHAVGAADARTYLEKFKQPLVRAPDLPEPVRQPLQDALSDYAWSVHEEALSPDPPAKGKRLLQITPADLHAYLLRQLPPGSPHVRGVDWWPTFKLPPDDVDLIDRVQFLRVVYHGNLTVRLDTPPPREPPEVNVFDSWGMRRWVASRQYRGTYGDRWTSPDDGDVPLDQGSP